MATSYLACEGQHDAALLGRLLGIGGFTPVTSRLQVQNGPFKKFVPSKYPDNLLGRPPEPHFWLNVDHLVAVHPVGGDGALPAALATVCAQVQGQLNHVGVFIDADDIIPVIRMSNLWTAIIAKNDDPGFIFPVVPGGIIGNSPKCGVFVLPDNKNGGSVETVLSSCANTAYPDLYQKAGTYLATIDRSALTQQERTRLERGTNPMKAHLGTMPFGN